MLTGLPDLSLPFKSVLVHFNVKVSVGYCCLASPQWQRDCRQLLVFEWEAQVHFLVHCGGCPAGGLSQDAFPIEGQWQDSARILFCHLSVTVTFQNSSVVFFSPSSPRFCVGAGMAGEGRILQLSWGTCEASSTPCWHLR